MIACIISILLIPICIVISSIIHFQILQVELNLDLSNLIASIMSNNNHLLLFIFTQLLGEFFIIYLLFFNKKGSLSTETNRITKNINTPKTYGNGQYGTAKWSTKKDLKEITKENSISAKGTNILKTNFKKGGIVIGLEKSKKQDKLIFIPEDYHTLTIGSTGAGKTRRLLLPSLCNYIFAGETVICTDPKRRNFTI